MQTIDVDLTDEHVKEFMGLYEKHFGVTLDYDDAKQRAYEMITLFQALRFPG